MKKDGAVVAAHEDRRASAAPPPAKMHPTETPEFKAWFGDSKVVDADGKPLVVYHGTGADFSEFANADGSHSESETARLGFWFATDSALANRWANGEGGNVRPVYLSISSPMDVSAERVRRAVESGDRAQESRLVDDMKRAAAAGGHDGIRVLGEGVGDGSAWAAEWARDSYIAFLPGQIKSAIGNRGTFDPKDPSLTKSHPATQGAGPTSTERSARQFGGQLLSPGEPMPDEAASSKYKKPRVEWQGLTIAIENPAGSVRRGMNRHGITWEVRMRFDYGEILGTLGVDGDPVDVILGPNLEAPIVYVVHQRKVNDWANYDEDKCCVGFDSQEDASQAFLSNYNDPRFLGPITAMPVAEFVAKVRATRDKPAMIKALFFARSAGSRQASRR